MNSLCHEILEVSWKFHKKLSDNYLRVQLNKFDSKNKSSKIFNNPNSLNVLV